MYQSIVVPDPSFSDFISWANFVTQQLLGYNIPSPVTDQWKTWAQALFATPDINGRGCPDPSRYTDWRAWASQARIALE